MKADSSIRNICVAAVKRHAIKPLDFRLTTLFEDDQIPNFANQVQLDDGELPISQTHIDISNWTLVTTRRVISCFDGNLQQIFAINISSWHWGMVKDAKKPHCVGILEVFEGNNMGIHIETGDASMVMIYSVMTLVSQVREK